MEIQRDKNLCKPIYLGTIPKKWRRNYVIEVYYSYPIKK